MFFLGSLKKFIILNIFPVRCDVRALPDNPSVLMILRKIYHLIRKYVVVLKQLQIMKNSVKNFDEHGKCYKGSAK